MDDATVKTIVIGVGGAGCAIAGRMASQAAEELLTIVVDSDACTLAASAATTRVQVGDDVLSGFGAGGDADKGRQAMESGIPEVLAAAEGARLALVVCGSGGGLGGGGTPVLVQELKTAGIRVVSFAVVPFEFEGRQRASVSSHAVGQLEALADVNLVAPAGPLMGNPDGALPDVFAHAADVLGGAILSLLYVLTSPGYIRLDYSDLRRIAEDTQGSCRFAFADAAGDDRARRVMDQLKSDAMLDGGDVLAQSRLLLMAVLGGPDLTLKEVGDLMGMVQQSVRPECRLALGTSVTDGWTGRLSAVVIAGEKRRVRSSVGMPDEETQNQAEEAALDAKPKAAPVPHARPRRGSRARQARLPLEAAGRGRFKDVEPTILNGEDFDVPTFVRRGIKIDR